MWPGIYEFLTTTLAVICCSIAIKLTDDYLDKDLDSQAINTNLAAKLGPGTMFYAILLIIFAAALNASASLPLFLGSYVIGMFNDLDKHYPLGLNGLQESFFVLTLGMIFWGWYLMMFSLLFVLAIQLIDDCIDTKIDQMSGYRNLAHRFGITECLLTAAAALLTAWWLDEQLFPPVLCGILIVYSIALHYREVRT